MAGLHQLAQSLKITGKKKQHHETTNDSENKFGGSDEKSSSQQKSGKKVSGVATKFLPDKPEVPDTLSTASLGIAGLVADAVSLVGVAKSISPLSQYMTEKGSTFHIKAIGQGSLHVKNQETLSHSMKELSRSCSPHALIVKGGKPAVKVQEKVAQLSSNSRKKLMSSEKLVDQPTQTVHPMVQRVLERDGNSIDCQCLQPVGVTGSSFQGRNLLKNKEGAPASTIKESSESSQTIDDQDGGDKGTNLKHENTVVHVDASGAMTPTSVAGHTAAGQRGSSGGQQSGGMAAVTAVVTGVLTSGSPTPLSATSTPTITTSTHTNSTQSTLVLTSQTQNHSQKQEILRVTQQLLDAITFGDYETYTSGQARTRQAEETRVWQKKDGRGWQCIHLHRSGAPSSTVAPAQPGPSQY